MAQIVKRKNKNGSTSYLFRVSTGYDRNGKQVTTSRTFTPPAHLDRAQAGKGSAPPGR